MRKLLLNIWIWIAGLEEVPPVYDERTLLQSIEAITKSILRAKTYWELKQCEDAINRLFYDRNYTDVAEHVQYLSNIINRKALKLQGI